MSEKITPDYPDHWAYDMRRCPMEGYDGTDLPDGPGDLSALPAPSGRRLQAELGLPPALLHPPENVLSLEACVFCGAREVVTDLGPHELKLIVNDDPVARELIEFPAFACAMCGEGWTDHRAEAIRDAWYRCPESLRNLTYPRASPTTSDDREV